jgi:tetratricopeptide (TPR) repeat protein
LARHLPAGRSLSEIRITPDGHGVLVHDEGNAWNPESGQLQIDFTSPDLASRAAPVACSLASSLRRSEDPQGAWEWFDRAVELEAVDPANAYRAYERALVQQPTLVEAHVNLGRLLQLAGQTKEAIVHYRRAIAVGTTDPTAAFNLGTALEELGRWDQALASYRRAIQVDERCADAHFNLARLYEQLGHRADALRHLRAYKRLAEGFGA